jgi:hypothetical protein
MEYMKWLKLRNPFKNPKWEEAYSGLIEMLKMILGLILLWGFIGLTVLVGDAFQDAFPSLFHIMMLIFFITIVAWFFCAFAVVLASLIRSVGFFPVLFLIIIIFFFFYLAYFS